MIKTLNLADDNLAKRALLIQQLAYRIEADLIGFDGIPALHETIDDLRKSSEVFIGYFVNEILAGILSYDIEGTTLGIGRLVVHPDYFRRGIGKALVKYVETIGYINQWIVSTGADNLPARKLYEDLDYILVEEVILTEGVKIVCYHKLVSVE